ncbi:unnamed protein product [Paramecium sonneborni]|uniref:Uncharacterized protein n=1 Tax=Paramecium sonneborni TaxID=65129 RepID=A0A8S1QU96_9CILI|nr:unnamed protein product [Paramecium sonneborni]
MIKKFVIIIKQSFYLKLKNDQIYDGFIQFLKVLIVRLINLRYENIFTTFNVTLFQENADTNQSQNDYNKIIKVKSRKPLNCLVELIQQVSLKHYKDLKSNKQIYI